MHWFSIIIVWVTQLLGFCKCVFNSFTERLTNWYVLWGIFLLFDQFLLDVILFNIFPMMNHYPTGFSSKCILIHVVLWKTKILVRAWMWIFNWVIYGACKKKRTIKFPAHWILKWFLKLTLIYSHILIP